MYVSEAIQNLEVFDPEAELVVIVDGQAHRVGSVIAWGSPLPDDPPDFNRVAFFAGAVLNADS